MWTPVKECPDLCYRGAPKVPLGRLLNIPVLSICQNVTMVCCLARIAYESARQVASSLNCNPFTTNLSLSGKMQHLKQRANLSHSPKLPKRWTLSHYTFFQRSFPSSSRNHLALKALAALGYIEPLDRCGLLVHLGTRSTARKEFSMFFEHQMASLQFLMFPKHCVLW